MTIDINMPAAIAIISVAFIVLGCWLERAWIFIPAMLVAFISTMSYCDGRPEAIAERAAEAAEKHRQSIPHVIREADGCKVYQFKTGDQWHYFTRCAATDTVTTDRHYQVSTKCGKNCTKTTNHVETIVTQTEKKQ